MIAQFQPQFTRSCLLLSLTLCFIAPWFVHAQEEQGGKVVSGRLQVYPLDAVVNSEGTVFVVDRNLPGVWRWKDGELSKLFEGSPKFRTPLNAARCIALDEKGNLLVGDTSTRDIYRVSSDGKAEPITGGQIGIPMDIAVAKDGSIYVADLELKKLLKIPPGSSDVQEVADVNPRGVTIDSQGKIWVVSQQNDEQLLIVSPDGVVEPVISKRVFEFPHQVVVNDEGHAFVTDGYKKGIWKIEPGQEPSLFCEGEPLINPVGIGMVEDALIVVDPRARTVFKIGKDGKPEAWFSLSR